MNYLEETKHWMWAGLVVIALISMFGVFHFMSKPAQLLDKVTTPEHIISSYEDYQEMYNTCLSICHRISILGELDDDNISGGFSKQERIVNEMNTLSRWVNEYNAKSKMIHKNMWKSNKLPYQLNLKTICNEN